MVRIRLRRTGAKKQPYYRVVVADSHSPRDGRHIEVIGHYNPHTEPETVKINEDRALYWLSQGAQPSDVVLRFLEKQGTLTRLGRLKAGEPLAALVAEYEVDAAGAVEPEAEVAAVEPEAAVTAEVAAVEPEAAVTAEVEAVEAQAEVEASAEPEPVEEETEESPQEEPADEE